MVAELLVSANVMQNMAQEHRNMVALVCHLTSIFQPALSE